MLQKRIHGFRTKSNYLRHLIMGQRIPTHMSEVSKVTDKIFRERINALIYEVNKIGVNYNQVVAIWQKQAGQVRQDGTPWMDTRAVEIRLTDLMRKTENLRDEFAVIYDLIKKYLAQKKELPLQFVSDLTIPHNLPAGNCKVKTQESFVISEQNP